MAQVLPEPREVWPRLVAAAIAVVVLAMAGVAAWAFTRPHRHLHLDLVPAGLALAPADATAEASDLLARLGPGVGSATQSTAYLTTAGQPVEVVAGTQDESSVDTSVTHLSELVATSSFRTGAGPLSFDERQPGERGGRLRCASLTVGATASAICVWADADTVGLTLAPLPEDQLAELTARMRVDIER